ncbi:sulfatase-like hydrolase/transferase [Lactobacillus sp. YT155]|uniref:sulfatase-like hydrolase/transferase n=1 Tax=Lactobacillus sp. YT155 TaxID=3060955 RepID=UPI00266013AD|nr:sulfatase-like hydrolase/transferase [Lactobacillus sp. YT155]MDO1605675.1 sulfatase-like hydrolase/transferase [Lactobacillus sp. YT155]
MTIVITLGLFISLFLAMILQKDQIFGFLATIYLNLICASFFALKTTEFYLKRPITVTAIFLDKSTSIKFLLLIIAFFVILFILFSFLNRKLLNIKITKYKNKKWIRYLIVLFVLSLGLFLLFSANWEQQTFSLLTPEQIIYNLTQPMEGADGSFLNSFVNGPLTKTLIFFVISIPFVLYIRNFKISFSLKKNFSLKFTTIFSLVGLVLSITFTSVAAVKADAASFYHYLTSDSSFIQNNYTKPTSKNVIFPTKKRNLIYIYVESLESTTISKELGGQWSTNLLPELTSLAEQPENVHFSDTNKEFGGAQQLPGTGWTVAGMVAQTSGLPLKVPSSNGTNQRSHQNYSTGTKDKFLAGVTSINDILAGQGYEQTLVFRSSAAFAGRGNYFGQHGVNTIDDLNVVKRENRLPKDYHVFWGYEDSKLFNFAKEDATKLSQGTKPFNLTLLTENTHFVGGYLESSAPQPYNDKYSNVIAYSDHQIVDFVKWVQQQPFYDNTTIIIQGDHLCMDSNYYKSVPDNKRRTFNLIINGAQPKDQVIKTNNRQFSTLDMFPTTLSALGVTIKGERLGLGTNLLSDKKTLIEKYGFEKVNKELSERSSYYTKTFMINK